MEAADAEFKVFVAFSDRTLGFDRYKDQWADWPARPIQRESWHLEFAELQFLHREKLVPPVSPLCELGRAFL
jgi:hypothetical protein